MERGVGWGEGVRGEETMLYLQFFITPNYPLFAVQTNWPIL